MVKFSDAAKVGAAVILAVVVLSGAYSFVGGDWYKLQNTTYYFVELRNAQGISRGTPVKLFGTDIGWVESKDINTDTLKSRVKFRVYKKYPLYVGAEVSIGQEGLLGSKFLQVRLPDDVTPASPAVDTGHVFIGQRDGGGLGLFGEEGLAGEFPGLFGDDGLIMNISGLTEEASRSLSKIGQLVDDFGGIVEENRGGINSSVGNIEEMTEHFVVVGRNLEMTTMALHDLTTDPRGPDKINKIADNIEEMSTNLNNFSAQLDTMIGDEQMQQDAKDSVRLLKETMYETKETMKKVQYTLEGVDLLINDAGDLVTNLDGGVTDGRETLQKYSSIGEGIETRTSVNVRAVDINRDDTLTGADHYVGDINFSVGNGSNYITVGSDNIGEESDFNLLAGFGGMEGFSFRGGVYRSELGLGASYNGKGGRGGVDVMVYDTEDPRVNAYGRVPVGDSINVVVGVEDVTEDAKASVGVGIDL